MEYKKKEKGFAKDLAEIGIFGLFFINEFEIEIWGSYFDQTGPNFGLNILWGLYSSVQLNWLVSAILANTMPMAHLHILLLRKRKGQFLVLRA